MDNLMDFIELLHLMVKWNFLDVSSMDNLLEIVGKVWSEVKKYLNFPAKNQFLIFCNFLRENSKLDFLSKFKIQKLNFETLVKIWGNEGISRM